MKSDDRPMSDCGDSVNWCRGPLLGKGTFGRVYKATNRRPKHNSLPPQIAVKSAEISDSDTLAREKQIMAALGGSPHLIQCFGAETTLGRNTDRLYYNLLLEYASAGSLSDRIRRSPDAAAAGLPEPEVKAHARCLLRGVKHIHDAGYVHCDLKPGNVLLVPAGRRKTAKIGDFGLAKKKGSVPCPRGTAMYLSPEAVMDFVQEAPADIWAVGCVVLEMLTGKRPWGGKTNDEILVSIQAEDGMPEIEEVVSEEARDFLERCFVRDSNLRFTADMLLSHPFVVEGDCEVVGEELLEEESNNQSTGDDDVEFSCSHLLLDESFSGSSSSDKFADIFHRREVVGPSKTRAGLDESNMKPSRRAYPAAANFSIAAGVCCRSLKEAMKEAINDIHKYKHNYIVHRKYAC